MKEAAHEDDPATTKSPGHAPAIPIPAVKVRSERALQRLELIDDFGRLAGCLAGLTRSK